jgi:hypothetical protein
MPSRRRKRYLDRLKLDSVSAKVIPHTNCDVLQIYSSINPPTSITSLSLDSVFLLMSYSRKDPYLLFYANSFLSNKGKIYAYRFLPVPMITPLQQTINANEYVDEENKFFSLIENYSQFFSTTISPKMIICHDIVRAIPSTLENEPVKPSLIMFGNSKRPKWYQIRTLSDKLIDGLDSPVIVYFSKKNNSNKNN